MDIFLQCGFGAPTFGCLSLDVAVPAAYVWHTEAPRNVSPHSESGGRTLPAPPPKPIAHPFFVYFSTEGFAAPTFGHGCARGLFLSHGRPSQSLTPFRVWRMNFACPTPQGYSPTVFSAFFRRVAMAPQPSSAYFWARLCPRPIFGTRRSLPKSRPIPSPADELRKPHPPRL